MGWKQTATIENGKLLVCMYCLSPVFFDQRVGWQHIEPFEKIPCNPWAKLEDRRIDQEVADEEPRR